MVYQKKKNCEYVRCRQCNLFLLGTWAVAVGYLRWIRLTAIVEIKTGAEQKLRPNKSCDLDKNTFLFFKKKNFSPLILKWDNQWEEPGCVVQP